MVKPYNEKISGLPFIDLKLHPDIPKNLVPFNATPGTWIQVTVKGKKFIKWDKHAKESKKVS